MDVDGGGELVQVNMGVNKKNNVKERRNKKYKCKRIRWIEENYCVVMLTQGIQILVQSIEVSWVADHEKNEEHACWHANRDMSIG